MGTNRDVLGSDGEFFGVDPVPTMMDIEDGRGKPFTLDRNGFTLVKHACEQSGSSVLAVTVASLVCAVSVSPRADSFCRRSAAASVPSAVITRSNALTSSELNETVAPSRSACATSRATRSSASSGG